MSIERSKPLVVGFDGLHRVGKGTQADLLENYLTKTEGSTVIVRGDGTREGMGQTPGDPFDPEWQARSRRLKTVDRTVEGWNEAAYILARELHARKVDPSMERRIIVDRTIISRTAFLLHRGVLTRGQQTTFNTLYPRAAEDQFPVEESVPDVVFDMTVDDPDILLQRLDPHDPKYEFRAQNIRGGFDAAQQARECLPKEVADRVITLDATEDANKIHKSVLSHLGSRGLLLCRL